MCKITLALIDERRAMYTFCFRLLNTQDPFLLKSHNRIKTISVKTLKNTNKQKTNKLINKMYIAPSALKLNELHT